MSDIASLGIKVDSEGAAIAIKSLEHLAQVSAEAEKATEKLGGATKQQAKQFKELDKAAKAAEITERRHIDQSLERARAYTKIASAEVAAMQAAEKYAETLAKIGAQRDLLNLGRAAASDNWTQAQASVFQLARGSSTLSR